MNHPPPPSQSLQGAQRHPEEGLGARPATPQPESAAAAREHVRELLLLAGVSLDSVPAADALLVTSELVTNAIRHGHGVTAFRADIADGVLSLSVADANPLPPTARTGSAEHPGGYGWPLVQCLAERVDCTTRADGKTITTAMRLS
ncbi:ATP-binding protein [Streptomyces racemochromogenes]|uniref:ATP-binding protein n=1 Tax=Streptomyces racemochromogenes TaxID=67353 RepID=A0ABW7PBI0_9ACTN